MEKEDYIAEARARKVKKLADVLEPAVRESGEPLHACIWAIGHKPELRQAAEINAGVKPGSYTTWMQVLGELIKRLSTKPRHRWLRRIYGKER